MFIFLFLHFISCDGSPPSSSLEVCVGNLIYHPLGEWKFCKKCNKCQENIMSGWLCSKMDNKVKQKVRIKKIFFFFFFFFFFFRFSFSSFFFLTCLTCHKKYKTYFIIKEQSHFGRFVSVLGTILDVLWVICEVGPNGTVQHLTSAQQKQQCVKKRSPQHGLQLEEGDWDLLEREWMFDPGSFFVFLFFCFFCFFVFQKWFFLSLEILNLFPFQ